MFGTLTARLIALLALAARAQLERSRAALGLVDAIGQEIRDGRLAVGVKLPTEAEIMAGYGVSRTVVREAISSLPIGARTARLAWALVLVARASE